LRQPKPTPKVVTSGLQHAEITTDTVSESVSEKGARAVQNCGELAAKVFENSMKSAIL
jgi:hypothetical protein